MSEPAMLFTWFWNTRGGCVEIRSPEAARSALNNGFVRLTEEERMRFKPGDYHPGHDLGDGSSVNVAPPQRDPPPMLPVSELYLIEI